MKKLFLLLLALINISYIESRHKGKDKEISKEELKKIEDLKIVNGTYYVLLNSSNSRIIVTIELKNGATYHSVVLPSQFIPLVMPSKYSLPTKSVLDDIKSIYYNTYGDKILFTSLKHYIDLNKLYNTALQRRSEQKFGYNKFSLNEICTIEISSTQSLSSSYDEYYKLMNGYDLLKSSLIDSLENQKPDLSYSNILLPSLENKPIKELLKEIKENIKNFNLDDLNKLGMNVYKSTNINTMKPVSLSRYILTLPTDISLFSLDKAIELLKIKMELIEILYKKELMKNYESNTIEQNLENENKIKALNTSFIQIYNKLILEAHKLIKIILLEKLSDYDIEKNFNKMNKLISLE